MLKFPWRHLFGSLKLKHWNSTEYIAWLIYPTQWHTLTLTGVLGIHAIWKQ